MAKAKNAPRPESLPESIPSGTVTFLFTDIEGSTKRWEQDHDAMKNAVARHDLFVREAIRQNGGYVFKTVGDAFCAAFHTPHEAVNAALAAQHALLIDDFSAVGGLRVRMGIHAGTADERDGDYFGSAVNRVARLMSIGHGGQVLISDKVRTLVQDDLVEGASLVDLGLRRLKDLMQPERVWQLTMVGLPSDFDPLTSLDARPNNLPIQTTALIGRERDLDAVKRMLTSHRLLTIFGAGGVGKTRLALQAGADLVDRYEHGVWFADLAPISDGGLVSSVVAKALDISQSGDSADDAILRSLKRKELMLIIDNCEHVLDAVASLADGILKNCPQVRLLTTSRQALGVSGEDVWRLPSLEAPQSFETLTADAALGFGAVALFAERATSLDKSFRLTDENAANVGEICRRLDGIPLAIELAAARVKVLSLPNLAKRLDERFKILTGGNRTALPRQKTLSALIDWSYGLLDAREQMLFSRLGVFAGGFSLDAALAVCAGNGIDQADVLDLLSSLTDKSLTLAETRGEQERYRLLESTRAFALEKVVASGERDPLSRRHAEYFRLFARDAQVSHGTQPTETWLPRQEPEIDNLRSALGWAIQQGHDPALGAEVAGALAQLWSAVGLSAEARSWIALALEQIDETTHPGSAAQLWLSLATLGSGDRCYEMAVRARNIFEQTGDVAGTADSLYIIAWHCHQAGRSVMAQEAVLQALDIYRKCGPEMALAKCINMQALIASGHHDFATSRELLREAIAKFRALGDERRVGGALTNLGSTEFAAGDTLEAVRCSTEALAILSRKKNARDLAIVYGNISTYRIAVDDIAGAREAGLAAMRYACEMHDERYIAEMALYLGCVAARSGRMIEAARLLGYSRSQFEALGLGNQLADLQSTMWLIKWLNARFEAAEIERLTAEGAAWTEMHAIEEAMKA